MEEDISFFKDCLSNKILSDLRLEYSMSNGTVQRNYQRIRVNILRSTQYNDKKKIRNLIDRTADKEYKDKWIEAINEIDDTSQWVKRAKQGDVYRTSFNDRVKK